MWSSRTTRYSSPARLTTSPRRSGTLKLDRELSPFADSAPSIPPRPPPQTFPSRCPSFSPRTSTRTWARYTRSTCTAHPRARRPTNPRARWWSTNTARVIGTISVKPIPPLSTTPPLSNICILSLTWSTNFLFGEMFYVCLYTYMSVCKFFWQCCNVTWQYA